MDNKNDFTAYLKPAGPGGDVVISRERAKSSLPVEALSKYLLGDGFLVVQHRLLAILQNDKLFSKTNQMNLSRPERYMLGLARAKKLRRLADQYLWSDEEYELAKYLVDDVSPYTLHTTMFRQTLREQASDEQKKYWLLKQQRWEIIGAYAQTEMGHGSNVRGIETTATWDPESKEFVIHSPTLTASKWWNGSLGRTANHSIVVAQLRTPKAQTQDGKTEYDNMGPHPFIVQVRSLENHEPLDGIVVGDIGPKYGYAPMDNAYCLFNNHRIPHSAMLSRYSKIDPETGVYSKPKNPKVVYGSLTEARSRIVMQARLVLARAVTVAVRYTTIRRQFKDKDDLMSELETSVLDYSTVQIRVLPLLATTFALHYTGLKMREVFWSTRRNIEKGDFSGLADLHSMSSGLKSLCTELAANGIEICRRAMGGHGFGGYSGLVQLNADYLSKPTVEGDNWMITQQSAKYLLKLAHNVVENPGGSSSNNTEQAFRRYYKNRVVTNPHDILTNAASYVDAFEHRAAYLAFKLHHARHVEKRPWNDLLIEMHQLSHAQSYAILITNFYNGLSVMPFDEATKSVFRDLFGLFACCTISNSAFDFLSSGALTQAQLPALPGKILELMRTIRPHAVRLVDAWAIPDYLLDSSLGRYDGKVYEDMFHRVHQLNPLNKITVNPDYRNSEIVMGADDGEKIFAKL